MLQQYTEIIVFKNDSMFYFFLSWLESIININFTSNKAFLDSNKALLHSQHQQFQKFKIT